MNHSWFPRLFLNTVLKVSDKIIASQSKGGIGLLFYNELLLLYMLKYHVNPSWCWMKQQYEIIGRRMFKLIVCISKKRRTIVSMNVPYTFLYLLIIPFVAPLLILHWYYTSDLVLQNQDVKRNWSAKTWLSLTGIYI